MSAPMSHAERTAHFTASLLERRKLGLPLDRATVELEAERHGVSADAEHAARLEAEAAEVSFRELWWLTSLGLMPGATNAAVSAAIGEAARNHVWLRTQPPEIRETLAACSGRTVAQLDAYGDHLIKVARSLEIPMVSAREAAEAAEARTLAIARAEAELTRLRAGG